MPSHPTASQYLPSDLLRVRQTCLYVFSQLPAHLLRSTTVVGGLVPSLLIGSPPAPEERHLGTADLDIGFALGSQGRQRYEELASLLGSLGFAPEQTKDRRAAGVRWRQNAAGFSASLIDVLPLVEHETDGSSAMSVPGVEFSACNHFALLDREPVALSGECILGEHRSVNLWVCGPGAYVIIKALTFRSRQLNKDAYDLFYVLRNYGAGVHDVFTRLAPLMKTSKDAQRALDVLASDFADPDGDGPVAVALFLFGRPDEQLQADVAGFTNRLLRHFGMGSWRKESW